MFQRLHIRPFLLPVIALISVNCLAADYENAPSLQAVDFFIDIPLEGKHYTIDAGVLSDGFMTRAVIRSDFGNFITSGPDMLQIRLHDIDALAKLRTFEASDEFKNGASKSANEKINALKHLYQNPNETAGGFGEGVSNYEQVAPATGGMRLTCLVLINHDAN